MKDTVRILIVEHRYRDRMLARQLLEDFGIEFNWISVSCADELRELATSFNPNIVMCADDSIGWRNAALGTLRILSTRTPIIMVSEINADALPLQRDASVEEAAQGNAQRDISRAAQMQPVAQLRSLRQRDVVDAQTPLGLPNMLEASELPLLMTDAKGWISYANTAACHMLREMREELLVTLIDSGYSQSPHTANWLNPVNERIEERDCLRPMPADNSLRVPRPHRLAYIDPLTRLPALAHINDLISRLTGQAHGTHSALAMVSVNLDGLSALHAAYGRSLGDDVMSNVSALMQSDGSQYGSIARLGPDDFLIAMPTLSNPADAAVVADRILESLTKPQGDLMTDVFSVAIPLPSSADEALRPLTLFSSSTNETIERELGDSMARQSLSLHYQPQFDIQTGRGCGMEALVRWHLSNGDVIAPSVFIPVAERSGIIRKLGGWVLRTACDSTAPWCQRDTTGLTLSVNVSALQIDEQFTEHLRDTLARTGFPAARLELEITESALIRNVESTLLCLTEWKRLGVRIAVDDFGTGYSNLSYLSRLPLDRLKLDRSLVETMTLDKKGAAVMRSMISLGAELGITVVAEGVETEGQLKMLQDFGCPQAQGYLLARPMPSKQAQVVLRKAWGNRTPATGQKAEAEAGVRYAS